MKELTQLRKELAKFHYKEDAATTEEELEILRKMFSIEGSFKALFRFMCKIESDNGTQIAYDINSLPSTANNYTVAEVAEEVKFKQMIVEYSRMKMEEIRNTFAMEANAKVLEAEKVETERLEADKAEQKASDIDAKGVSPDM